MKRGDNVLHTHAVPNGGFARAAAIGITTLECTYYALATLEALQVENITRYIDPMDGHPYNSSNQ